MFAQVIKKQKQKYMNMDIQTQPRDKKGKFKKVSFKRFLIKLIIVLGVGAYATFWINHFFEGHRLRFQSPIQTPVWIEKREPPKVGIIIPAAEAKTEPLRPRYNDEIDQYIYEKFGKDGDLAVKIARAENGTGQCDRTNVNTNGSIDIGRFMINTVHFKRFPLGKLVDCKYNVDAAYQIYSEQGGFQAWVVYTNGNYKKINLEKYLK